MSISREKKILVSLLLLLAISVMFNVFQYYLWWKTFRKTLYVTAFKVPPQTFDSNLHVVLERKDIKRFPLGGGQICLLRNNKRVEIPLAENEYCSKIIKAAKSNIAFAIMYNFRVVDNRAFGQFFKLIKISLPNSKQNIEDYQITTLISCKTQSIIDMLSKKDIQRFKTRFKSEQDVAEFLNRRQPIFSIMDIEYVSPKGKFIVIKTIIPKKKLDSDLGLGSTIKWEVYNVNSEKI